MDLSSLLQTIRYLEMLMSTSVFGLLLITAIIGYSRSIALRELWEAAVREGRLKKLTQEDLLRPWLVRIFQRGRTYLNFANIIVSITGVVLIQIIALSTIHGPEALIIGIMALRIAGIIIVMITLLCMVFSTQIGLRAEVRALRKLLPEYEITFDDLIALHEEDRYFSPKDLLPPE